MHQGPPAPLPRPDAAAFRYHTYRYPGDTAAGPFQLYGGPLPVGSQLYSLVEDLNGLMAWGNAVNHVPNLAVAPVPGSAQTAGGRDTLMLSLGALGRVRSGDIQCPVRPGSRQSRARGIDRLPLARSAHPLPDRDIRLWRDRFGLRQARRHTVEPRAFPGSTGLRTRDPHELLKQDSPGTLMDYAAQQHQSRAFTIELDPPLTVANG